MPVTLGDDTALTLFALLHGRAVHQPTAVAMPVYPETLSHHLRQWTRWMRASTIRTLWRIRYLRPRSYAWWFVRVPAVRVLRVGGGVAGRAVRLARHQEPDLRQQHRPGRLAGRGGHAAASRCTAPTSAGGAGWPRWRLLPFAALWYLLVLRQIRFYGMATCHRQGWITRKKVEVTLAGSPAHAAEVLVNE